MSLGEWEPELAIVAAPLFVPDHSPLVIAALHAARAWDVPVSSANWGLDWWRQRSPCRKKRFSRIEAYMKNSGEGSPSVTLTVERGLEVLRAFHAERTPLSNAELVRRTGLSKATVSRLTTTLIRIGFLRRAGGGRQFELGAGALSMGHAYLESNPVRA